MKTNPSSLSDDDQFVYQDVVDIDPDVKYAFSVKSVNVQGSSDFSRERIKELIGRITSGRPRPEEVGQLLLDLPLFRHYSIVIFRPSYSNLNIPR